MALPGLTPHAIAQVHDTRAERAAVEEFEVLALFSAREERGAATNEHGVDAQPVLVDKIKCGSLGGERGATDTDVPLPRLSAPPFDLLGQPAGSQLVAVLHRDQSR